MKLLKLVVGLLALICMVAFIKGDGGLSGLLLLMFSSISLAMLITEHIEI